MHKIVKQFGYGVKTDAPVAIDNSVYVPSNDEDAALTPEERKKIEQDKKAAEEKAFNDAVEVRLQQVLLERSAELEEERNNIIERAKREAKEISGDAKAATISVFEKTTKECSLLKAQARQEGYDEGYKEGHDEIFEKCQKYIDGAAKLLADINARKDAYYISNEKELKDTLFVMVEKIVKAELEVNPLIIERIIADAAKAYRNSDYIKISVSDGEIAQKIKTDKKFINKLIPFIKDIDVEILEEAEDGTVILDDEQNIIDASVPTQLDFLKEILKNTRGDDE